MSTLPKSRDALKCTTTTIKKVTPILSLMADGIAGGVEAATTYPFEYTKTRSQLRSTASHQQSVFRLVQQVVKTEGITASYTGCSTLVVGTAFKAGVRFLTFDSFKNALADDSGKLSASRGVVAGMAAGCVESVIAVTPTERIKTALIDDTKGDRKCRGSIHATKSLVADSGLGNLYKGLISTTIKQSATSAVRMGSYNYLRELSKSYEFTQTTVSTFLTGALAGTLTAYATQPFDTINTRAESAAGVTTVDHKRFKGLGGRRILAWKHFKTRTTVPKWGNCV